jgi:hypothetical protein
MVFSAELTAILRCAEILTKNLITKRITICCDSKADLVTLAKTTTESSLVRECMQVLGKLSEINSYFSVDTRARRQRLAKERAIEIPPNQFTAVSFSVGKSSSRNSWN